MIIAVSALIGFAIGLVAGYALATLGTTNQKTGVLSDKRDCGVETEGISQSVKVLAPLEVSYQETSSSTNYSSSTVRVTGDTFVTPHGSVYHSRRNCGKLKAEVWESFCPVWSAGMTNHQRSMKIVCRSPLNGSEFLKTWLRCQVSSPRKGVWNCIGLPEEFLLRVVVS